MYRCDLDCNVFMTNVLKRLSPNDFDTMHTAEHFRQELWMPKLLDREYYQAWLDAGAKSMEDRCKARTRAILEEHEPEPISGDLDRALTEIVKAARQS